ncbi:pyrimidine 5-nucleotidase like protein [Teratosphaeria destructans]|uniref:Pyrimidine 5-nucleotidase like protein n=1 Tax=Teratosphaeria destructans TaxID=418781 RepID=A0A9W7VY04_9PEZI|nr:pyrimidine 5-nucleotidase like protein [Teratosphaeria destructans]
MSANRPVVNGNPLDSTDGTTTSGKDGRKVFFFDIDNCLYPKSYRIHDHMSELIDAYFQNHLSVSREEATELHQRYYKDYGLAIEGLVRHHKVDPMEYNAKVDDALPLEDIIRPNPRLRRLLEDIDHAKIKLWLFTNAYITHGRRVVKLLGIEDLFEGITFCDYAAKELLCKPRPEMYAKAMREAGVSDVKDCYFVDDSALNARGAREYGWRSVHLVEPDAQAPEKPVADYQIADLEELREVFPEIFRAQREP